MKIEVVSAQPGGADTVSESLDEGATVGDALRASGILERRPGIDVRRLGVFGKEVSAQTRLRDGDRVEIYRPLPIDPKEARRRRARKKR